RGEAQPLDDAERGQKRELMGHEKGRRGCDEQAYAERHEEAAPDTVEPVADHGLADDAGRAVDALDEADLGFRAAEALDVQRQENEAAQAGREDEIGQRRPREKSRDDGADPGDHQRCGPLSPRRTINETMTRVAVIPVAMNFPKCSTRRT